MKPNATIKRIRETLNYNSESGIFTWKVRDGDTKHINIWNKKFAGKITGYRANQNGNFAIQICLDNKLYRAHRLAWAYEYGYWPHKEIDHINLNSCDNRICNLREADRSQNECNKSTRIDNKLGIKGIHWDKTRKKFFVQLKFKDISLKKRFNDLEAAKNFYNEQAIKYHGEFARLC